MRHPIATIVIGFVLVLTAAILAWLIVLPGYLTSSLALDLSVFTMSMGGLMLGIIGSASYVKVEREKRKNRKE